MPRLANWAHAHAGARPCEGGSKKTDALKRSILENRMTLRKIRVMLTDID